MSTWNKTDTYVAPCCCGACQCEGLCFNGSTPHGSYSQYIVEIIDGTWSAGVLDTTQPFTILDTLTLNRVANCRYSDATNTPYGRFFINQPGNQVINAPCAALVNHLFLFSTYLLFGPLFDLGEITRPYDSEDPTLPSTTYYQLPIDGSVGIRHYWGGTFDQCCADGCNEPLTGDVTLTVSNLSGAPSYTPVVLAKNPTDPDPSVPPPGWGDEVGFYFAINELMNQTTGWRLRLWRAPGAGTPVYTLDSTYATANGWTAVDNIRLAFRECSPFRAGGTVRLRDPDGIVRDRTIVVESTESPGASLCEPI